MIPHLKHSAAALTFTLTLSLAPSAFAAADGYGSSFTGRAIPNPLPGQAGVQEFDGEYIVPAPLALQSVASFKTNYCLSKDTDGKLILAYALPEDIVGKNKPRIAIKETTKGAGFINFQGSHGSASCRKTAHEMTCFVLYPGFDTTGSQDVVRDKFAGAEDLQARLDLAAAFSADPKGVVHFAIP
jgi:hypothetical protein